MKNIKVVQDPEKPVEKEVLAEAIIKISKSFGQLLSSGLNRKAIIALIQYDTKLGYGVIEALLRSLETLAESFTR